VPATTVGGTPASAGGSTLARVHFIADHRGGTDPAQVSRLVAAVLAAGVTCVQVRSKDCTDRERYQVAAEVVALCRAERATCIINDRVDVALALGADGAHVGLSDLPVAAARRLLGPGAILGASAYTLAEAAAAVDDGAGYVGVGPCYLTATKGGLPEPVGPEGLAAVARGVGVPVVAIGGVTPRRVPELIAAGAYGIAVISAISGAADPGAAAREFVAEVALAVASTSSTREQR
jgi:thiamine-phosphate pyrophosphorylase